MGTQTLVSRLLELYVVLHTLGVSRDFKPDRALATTSH